MMDQPNNPVYPPKRPAGSVPPKATPQMFQTDPSTQIWAEANHLYMEFTFKVDERLKSMFEEAFKAGMAYENDTYEPDFETWFAAAVERWRNA